MIHQYKLNEYNIVIDEGSGSVHSVDEVAYDMIALYEKESRDNIIRLMLDKYSGCEGVTGKELEECYDDITELELQLLLCKSGKISGRQSSYEL